jgi:hypothetical protein
MAECTSRYHGSGRNIELRVSQVEGRCTTNYVLAWLHCGLASFNFINKLHGVKSSFRR